MARRSHTSVARWIALGTCLTGVMIGDRASGALLNPSTSYYVGQFNGTTPQDDLGCGSSYPCATLAYWTANRRSVLRSGDTVRIAPGIYSGCIYLDTSGVTYEGRAANNSPLGDYTSVVVDANGAPSGPGTLCRGNGVRMEGAGASDVTVRFMRFTGASGTDSQEGTAIRIQPTSPVSGLTFDTIQADDADRNGILVMPPITAYDCNGVRRVSDLTITGCWVHNVRGVFGGISVGCVDGALLTDNLVHDNYGAGVDFDADCAGSANGSGCDNHDGIQLTGTINAIVAGNEVYRNGQDGIGIGGHYQQTYDVIVERNTVHDNGERMFGKISGGSHHIVVQDNVAWGPGLVQSVVSCVTDITFHRNIIHRTNQGSAYQLQSKVCNADYRDNVFIGSGGNSVVLIGYNATYADGIPAALGCESFWTNNTIVNRGTGDAIESVNFSFSGATCSHASCIVAPCCSVATSRTTSFAPSRRPAE